MQSNLVIRNFLVALKLFLNANCSLFLWSKLKIGNGKWFLNTNLFLIKTFLITKFDCTIHNNLQKECQVKFPHLVRKLIKFSLHKGKVNEETVWNFQAFSNSKKNSCHGNYMRKYGMLHEVLHLMLHKIKRIRQKNDLWVCARFPRRTDWEDWSRWEEQPLNGVELRILRPFCRELISILTKF